MIIINTALNTVSILRPGAFAWIKQAKRCRRPASMPLSMLGKSARPRSTVVVAGDVVKPKRGARSTRLQSYRKPSMRSSICYVALSLVLMGPASADVRIISSSGGVVGPYMTFFSQLRKSGQRVIIDGPCLSACTLVLNTIPRNRICVTQRAVLGFHAPVLVDRTGRSFRSREATRAVAASYPSGVRKWIKQKGGLKRDLIYLRGRELASLYRRC